MVNKIKTIGILTVLMLLTLCFIFLPDFISNQNENTLMNNKTNWNYTPDNNTEISSVQVIRLYQSRNFDCDFSFNIEMIPAENCAGVMATANNLLFVNIQLNQLVYGYLLQ